MTISETNTRGASDAEWRDDVVGYGAAEVAYAISLSDGMQRQQAEKFLQVNADFLTEQIVAIGASSLLARGELILEGDSLVPRGGIRLLAAVVQTAFRWTEIALIGVDGAEAAVYVQSADLSLFLQPTALGSWEMVVKAPEVPDSALLKQIIDGSVERNPSGVVYFGTETAGAAKNHLFVRSSDAGRWDVADVHDDEPEQGADGVETTKLLALISNFVAPPQ